MLGGPKALVSRELRDAVEMGEAMCFNAELLTDFGTRVALLGRILVLSVVGEFTSVLSRLPSAGRGRGTSVGLIDA